MTSRRFSLNVPEDLANWLDREAARQGRTRNNLIILVLESYRKNPKRIEQEDTGSQD